MKFYKISDINATNNGAIKIRRMIFGCFTFINSIFNNSTKLIIHQCH